MPKLSDNVQETGASGRCEKNHRNDPDGFIF